MDKEQKHAFNEFKNAFGGHWDDNRNKLLEKFVKKEPLTKRESIELFGKEIYNNIHDPENTIEASRERIKKRLKEEGK